LLALVPKCWGLWDEIRLDASSETAKGLDQLTGLDQQRHHGDRDKDSPVDKDSPLDKSRLVDGKEENHAVGLITAHMGAITRA